MKAKEFIPASKPRNFVAKNQKTAGAGAHKDKKKAEKQGYEKHKGKSVAEGINPDGLIGYVYDSKNRYLGQWDGQRLVIDPNVWKKWKDENGQDWASGTVGMARDRIAAGVWKVHQEKQDMTEGSKDIGSKIKSLYQRIYDQGDDAIDYMYYESPIFAKYWDEYEGELDEIIAEVDPKELQIIHDELEDFVLDQGIKESVS